MNQQPASPQWPAAQYHDLVAFQAMGQMQMQMLLAQRDREIAQLAQQLADAKDRAENAHARADRAEQALSDLASVLPESGQQP